MIMEGCTAGAVLSLVSTLEHEVLQEVAAVG